MLLILLVAAAAYPWSLYVEASEVGYFSPAQVYPLLLIGGLGGLVFALITIFMKRAAMFTAPVYAVLEGLFLGSVSALVQAQFPDVPIVLQAACLTFLIFGMLLFCYVSRIIKPTQNLLLGIAAATGGICLLYLFTFIMHLVGIQVPFIHDTGPIGIGISLVFTVVAALNLVIDFDFIERGVEQGAPKYMEWYASFGLLVTLAWLYFELLHLLAKLNSSR
jgi:uncharacterized YccA/Bax inhibitor family protein